MLKKTISYTDFNGVKRTEDFYFNLTKGELLEMEMSVMGGFVEKLQKMITSGNTPALMKEFKTFIFKSYGEKSDDGRRFIKSDELSTAFMQTEAYSELFTEISTDANAASAFLIGIMPSELGDKLPKNLKEALPEDVMNALPGNIKDALLEGNE